MARFNYLLCAVPLLLATGCNRAGYEVAPVHGIVTVDDKPLFQGKILFAPIAKGNDINPGKSAFGKIQADGTYRLTTFKDSDGAIVGEHWATIINSEEDLPEDVPEFARVQVPKKVTVEPAKDNQIDLKLTSEIVSEYREDDR